MPDIATDTHGLIWYLEDSPRLGPAARKAFDACDRGDIVVYVPTICLVEIIQGLIERVGIGRGAFYRSAPSGSAD